MLRKEVTITNTIGLHARPATFFVQKANTFASTNVWIERDDRKVNAKSLLGVLSLGITQGMSINIVAEGPKEVEAVNSLVAYIKAGLTEL